MAAGRGGGTAGRQTKETSNHLGQHLCLNLVPQVRVHTAFEHPQGRRLQNLSGQPVWVLDHPRSQKVFPDTWSVSTFHFVPSASAPATGCFWEHPWAPALCVFMFTLNDEQRNPEAPVLLPAPLNCLKRWFKSPRLRSPPLYCSWA